MLGFVRNTDGLVGFLCGGVTMAAGYMSSAADFLTFIDSLSLLLNVDRLTAFNSAASDTIWSVSLFYKEHVCRIITYIQQAI